MTYFQIITSPFSHSLFLIIILLSIFISLIILYVWAVLLIIQKGTKKITIFYTLYFNRQKKIIILVGSFYKIRIWVILGSHSDNSLSNLDDHSGTCTEGYLNWTCKPAAEETQVHFNTHFNQDHTAWYNLSNIMVQCARFGAHIVTMVITLLCHFLW